MTIYQIVLDGPEPKAGGAVPGPNTEEKEANDAQDSKETGILETSWCQEVPFYTSKLLCQ